MASPHFAPVLERTLHRALDAAASRRHEYATVEHLLLALIDDEHAAQMMLACAIDLPELRAAVVLYLDTELEVVKSDEQTDPSPTSEFQRVIQRSILHVQSSGRDEVTGANVLVALFSERESYAVGLLNERDMSRLDAVSFLSHGTVKAKPIPPFDERDFFISYAAENEKMAREIAAVLAGASYTSLVQFRDFRPGMNFVREMQRGLAASGRLIALLSPAYEASDHCQAEWSAAYAQDPGSRHGKIVPFLIEPTQLNPLAKQIIYRSLVGLTEPERKAAILEAILYHPAQRRSVRQIRKEAGVLASPDVNITGSVLNAVPNRGTDVPVGRGELVDLVKTLRELLDVLLNELPANAPGIVRRCFFSYRKHLGERRTQPILGLLDNLMSPVKREYKSVDVAMWGSGVSDLMETVFRRHEELHGHFPRSDSRERFFAETPIDEEKAVGESLVAPVVAASNALRDVSEAGYTTPAFDEVVAGQEEQAKDLASLPPTTAKEDMVGIPTAKNRFVLAQIGFYERILAATAAVATLAAIPAVQAAGLVLERSIEQLVALLM